MSTSKIIASSSQRKSTIPRIPDHGQVSPTNNRSSSTASVPHEADTFPEGGRADTTSEVLRHDTFTSNYASVNHSDSSHGSNSTSSSPVGHCHHSRQLHTTKSCTGNIHVTNRHRGGLNWNDGDKITLLVDGKRFMINPSLIIKHPNTMLGRLVRLNILAELQCVSPDLKSHYRNAWASKASPFTC